MDLSIPYLITSSALILFDWITYKSQSPQSSVTESTESSSRVTTLSDGLSIRETDKSGTELILDPPIDHPMHHYKDKLINIWIGGEYDVEYAIAGTGLVVDLFISRLNGIDNPIIAILVYGNIYHYDAEAVMTCYSDSDGEILDIHECHHQFH